MSDEAYPVDEISASSPDMNEAEMTALTDSIATLGQQVPILVWRGRVIDGRKRLAACQAIGIKPRVTILADTDAPEDHARALNLLRTHYTTSQRAAFAEKIATQNKSDGTRVARAKESATTNLLLLPPTQIEAAAALGVSPSAVITARRIRRSSAPEVMGAVESGALTLHAAAQISAQVPRENQAQVVEEVIRESKGKRNTPSRIINAAVPGKKRPPARDITVVRNRSLQTIHACCSALDQFMGHPIAAESDVAGWREWIKDSLHTLNKFNRQLEGVHERSA